VDHPAAARAEALADGEVTEPPADQLRWFKVEDAGCYRDRPGSMTRQRSGRRCTPRSRRRCDTTSLSRPRVTAGRRGMARERSVEMMIGSPRSRRATGDAVVASNGSGCAGVRRGATP